MDMSSMGSSHMQMANGPQSSMPGMAPSPEAMAHSPAAHQMSGSSMTMSMAMWFQATTETTLWFREWFTDDHGKYAGACIGLFVLGFVWEALQRLRFELLTVQRRHQSYSLPEDLAVDNSAQNLVTSKGNGKVEEFRYNPRTAFWTVTLLWLVQSVVYTLQVFFAYLLMLAVMTYNVGFLIVVVLGLGFGFLFVSPLRSRAHVLAYQLGVSPTCCS